MDKKEKERYKKICESSNSVDEVIKKSLKGKTPTPALIFPLLSKETQDNITNNNLVLHQGMFGWAVGPYAGIGTACCLSIQDFNIK